MEEKTVAEITSEQTEEEKKKKRRWLLLLLLLLLITVSAIGISIWAIFFRGATPPDPTLTPDYAPRIVEENATPIEGEKDKDKMSAPNGGGAVNITFSDDITINLSDKKVTLYYANPTKSAQDVLLQVVVKDTVVAQSGRITPGNQINSLALLPGAEKKLSVGGYEGKLVALPYNPETGEKAMVNVDMPLKIEVVE